MHAAGLGPHGGSQSPTCDVSEQSELLLRGADSEEDQAATSTASDLWVMSHFKAVTSATSEFLISFVHPNSKPSLPCAPHNLCLDLSMEGVYGCVWPTIPPHLFSVLWHLVASVSSDFPA